MPEGHSKQAAGVEVEGKAGGEAEGEAGDEMEGEVAPPEVEEQVEVAPPEVEEQVEVAPPEVEEQVAEVQERLSIPEYRVIEERFEAAATIDDLREPYRSNYEHVMMTGAGVCGRCSWTSGCDNCDEAKAWSFACRATLYEAMDTMVRPKAKPKGRPKRSAL